MVGMCAMPTGPASAASGSLEEQLLREQPADLARDALTRGDPGRGAIVFHQPALTCVKCHTAGEGEKSLGPDLTEWEKKPTGEDLARAILTPSHVLRKGYETVVVNLRSGKTATGLFVDEKPDALLMRDLETGKVLALPKKQIEEWVRSPESVMPRGLVNQLGTRQQFLDLVRYLMEIAEHGPRRARELKPPESLFVLQIPEYEKDIDHAGMMRDLDRKSYERGEAIYSRLCVNCHGTHDQPGSLPTSLRFAEGTFKNGPDPFSMYQTLTRGFGMMAPQTWMVPQQKYDVIHYIREAYLKPRNSSQYVRLDDAYLGGLPRGTTRGPAPRKIEPWVTMDYGPRLINTYEVGKDGSNFAYKGIAVRLDPGPGGVSRGKHWMVFDHDTLRVAGAWSGSGFIDWRGIHLDGAHQIHPRIVGEVRFANPTGPGWANPQNDRFDDPRLRGRDGKTYGPLPRSWAHYKGLYQHGQRTVIAYTVGETDVLEMPGMLTAGEATVFTRTFNIGPRTRHLILQVAKNPTPEVQAGILPEIEGAGWIKDEAGNLRLRIPAGDQPLRFTLWMGSADADSVSIENPGADLTPLTNGGPQLWTQKLQTKPVIGEENGPFAVDILSWPETNPWLCRVRLTGLDFLPDGKKAVVSAWDGDVWLVSGIDRPQEGLTWQRIASGLFQPLGVKIVSGKIYVTCRDQLVVLHDLNGDGETDFYENFNNDHMVTDHFHEFAMGLQTDAEGNFYYAKSARHALPALVPHHGTLLRISKDGAKTDILATGFRAANGVCLNPDGSFFVTDQEGHWMPKNRINWVQPGRFYGNMMGYHDVTDTSDDAMEAPLCWITNNFDRSPGELLWVESDAWGPLRGSLLQLSYGTGKIFIVPHEKVQGRMQGGMCALPIPAFPTGVMRGRFHPGDGQLYACGMFAWAGNRQQPGGIYRIRYTGKPVMLPLKLQAKREGIQIRFSGRVNPKVVSELANYKVKVWSLRRTKQYGSQHHDERPIRVTSARLVDPSTILLEVPDLKPTWCMEIMYWLEDETGKPFEGVIHNTIHALSPPGAD